MESEIQESYRQDMEDEQDAQNALVSLYLFLNLL